MAIHIELLQLHQARLLVPRVECVIILTSLLEFAQCISQLLSTGRVLWFVISVLVDILLLLEMFPHLLSALLLEEVVSLRQMAYCLFNVFHS